MANTLTRQITFFLVNIIYENNNNNKSSATHSLLPRTLTTADQEIIKHVMTTNDRI